MMEWVSKGQGRVVAPPWDQETFFFEKRILPMYTEFKELQKHLEDGAHVTCLGLGKSDLFSYLFGKAWLKTLRKSVI